MTATIVTNAGLVIVAPFITELFSHIGVLTSNGQQIVPGAAARACQLLQYLVYGRLDAPDGDLALNKLLCGVVETVPPLSAASSADLTACDALLADVVAKWKVIDHTSVAELQEAFLRRDGHLVGGRRATLNVPRRTLDVLLDQVPWSISVIDLPWMMTPIHVRW